MPDVRLYKEQKNFPVGYSIPSSGTPVIIDGIAIVRGGPNPEEAKRFYEFVTTPESLAYAAHKYYRIPVRTDLDRAQLPAWMNEPFTRMPLDWDLLRKNGNDWLRYWDTEIREYSTDYKILLCVILSRSKISLAVLDLRARSPTSLSTSIRASSSDCLGHRAAARRLRCA